MTLPLSAIWLDAEGVGQMLNYEPRIIRERIACRPDFPKPARIGGTGHCRWNAAEVAEWMRTWQPTGDQSNRAATSDAVGA